MDISLFIARRLHFKGNLSTAAVAISFLVMIIAIAVSSGFRHEIRSGLSSISGDIQITPPDLNVFDHNAPIERYPSYLSSLESIEAVDEIVPVVYRAGIVKHGGEIHGVIFKGVPSSDTVALGVSIPVRLSEITGIMPGDKMLTYFVSDKVKVRQFNVIGVHDALVQTDDRLVVYADIADLQRLDGWTDGQVSAFEILLGRNSKSESDIIAASEEAGAYINAFSSEDEADVIAMSSVMRYPQLFDWLKLIDFNVIFILALMIIVAGFNMISGLLIMLFENISTIGILKAMGMRNLAISKVFLASSSVIVMRGMFIGNLLALLFCLIQGTTHILKLNPENYFVSYVPVHVDIELILAIDVIAFAVILLLMFIPCMFITRVDPAQTVRVR
ncbi:MAG: ABC transporter permease [Bacteroidales bacterium]|nr:ABC transporter permease [Bacteroidales bacterium]